MLEGRDLGFSAALRCDIQCSITVGCGVMTGVVPKMAVPSLLCNESVLSAVAVATTAALFQPAQNISGGYGPAAQVKPKRWLGRRVCEVHTLKAGSASTTTDKCRVSLAFAGISFVHSRAVRKLQTLSRPAQRLQSRIAVRTNLEWTGCLSRSISCRRRRRRCGTP